MDSFKHYVLLVFKSLIINIIIKINNYILFYVSFISDKVRRDKGRLKRVINSQCFSFWVVLLKSCKLDQQDKETSVRKTELL